MVSIKYPDIKIKHAEIRASENEILLNETNGIYILSLNTIRIIPRKRGNKNTIVNFLFKYGDKIIRNALSTENTGNSNIISEKISLILSEKEILSKTKTISLNKMQKIKKINHIAEFTNNVVEVLIFFEYWFVENILHDIQFFEPISSNNRFDIFV